MSAYSSAVRESTQTLLCRPFRALAYILMCTLCFSSGPLVEGLAAQKAINAAADAEEQGASVLVARNAEGKLSGEACESLGRLAIVRAAGGIGRLRVISPKVVPGLTFRGGAASIGYFQVLYPEGDWGRTPGGTVVAGASVPDEFGVRDGSLLSVDSIELTHVLVAKPHIRARERERWLTTVTTPLDYIDECWIEANPGAIDDLLALMPSTFKAAEKLELTRLKSPEASESVINAFLTRATIPTGAIGGALAGFFLVLGIIGRRHEYALYRVTGLAARHTAVAAILESAMLLTAASLLASTLVYFVLSLSHASGSTLAIATSQLLISVGAAGIIATVAAMMVNIANPSSVIRSR